MDNEGGFPYFALYFSVPLWGLKLFSELCRKQQELWGMRGGGRGCLFNYPAECAAQQTVLHNHHEGQNTLCLMFNSVVAYSTIYPAFWSHCILEWELHNNNMLYAILKDALKGKDLSSRSVAERSVNCRVCHIASHQTRWLLLQRFYYSVCVCRVETTDQIYW